MQTILSREGLQYLREKDRKDNEAEKDQPVAAVSQEYIGSLGAEDEKSKNKRTKNGYEKQ